MKKLLLFLMISFSFGLDQYIVPPSNSTYGYVPVISDEMMQECVKIYNQALEIEKYINLFKVYSSNDYNTYNLMVNKYNEMIDWFNINCAGKQSYSACKAARELNIKNGLKAQDCD